MMNCNNLHIKSQGAQGIFFFTRTWKYIKNIKKSFIFTWCIK